jgi:hypothetical protein
MWRKKTAWYILCGLAVAIKIFSLFPMAVERYYAQGIYPVISGAQRILFGWIPFSIGDLLYAVAIIILGYRLYHLVRRVMRRKANWQYWKNTLALTVFVTLFVYVSFNFLWGLNYNRPGGVAWQLELKSGQYSATDLKAVMEVMVIRLNALDSLAKIERPSLARKRTLFAGAFGAYENLAKETPLIKYSFRSVKPSLFSYLGNYLGYTGYYNPFTGEAQVNTTTPLFVQPFTTCHEIGHQLGYAKENEANFAGFLAARYSDNPAFRYSMYFDMYAYTRSYLFSMDSTAVRRMDAQLRPGIKADFKELREFVQNHRNPVEAVIDELYSEYLKANEQPSGKRSYSDVIGWLISYYSRYGKEAL